MTNIPENYTFKNGLIRPDFIFSYWIFVWVLIYFISNILLNKNIIPSPLLAIYIGFFVSLYGLSYLVSTISNNSILMKFLVMLIVIKTIPLLITIYLSGTYKINWNYDLKKILILLLFYFVYLVCWNVNVFDVYNYEGISIINNDNKTPFFYLLTKIYPLVQ
jgi:hypothetical protein